MFIEMSNWPEQLVKHIEQWMFHLLFGKTILIKKSNISNRLVLKYRAKMRLCSFWPAIMVKNPPAEVKEKSKPGQICVFFFGTKK